MTRLRINRKSREHSVHELLNRKINVLALLLARAEVELEQSNQTIRRLEEKLKDQKIAKRLTEKALEKLQNHLKQYEKHQKDRQNSIKPYKKRQNMFKMLQKRQNTQN
jgi:hypothetical protein